MRYSNIFATILRTMRRTGLCTPRPHSDLLHVGLLDGDIFRFYVQQFSRLCRSIETFKEQEKPCLRHELGTCHLPLRLSRSEAVFWLWEKENWYRILETGPSCLFVLISSQEETKVLCDWIKHVGCRSEVLHSCFRPMSQLYVSCPRCSASGQSHARYI